MTPLAKAREDLTQIVELTHRLLDQAIHGSHNAHLDAAHEIPGQDAMIMLGPSANFEAWAHQVATRLRLARPDRHPWITDDHITDSDPPLMVLTSWEAMWRTHLDLEDNTQRPTIERAATFLHTHLHTMATITRPSFDDFTTDIANLRTHLEATCNAGDPDETGAPCLHCRALLIRRTDPRLTNPPDCPGHLNVCPWPYHRCADRGGLLDIWDCPRCHRTYTDDEYRLAVKASYQALTQARPA